MKFIFSFILFCLVLIPSITWADEPVNNFLVGIPGIGDPSGDFDGYIQAIYAMFISIAALLAVVKIIIAGVKYMFTDIVPQKTQAKKDIQGALLGLVVVLGAVLILTVINPELTNFNIEQNQIEAPEIDYSRSSVLERGLSTQDSLTILDYCSGENAGSCTRQSCDYFENTDNGIILGSAAKVADWALSRAACPVWCDGLNGKIVGTGPLNNGECVYSENFQQEDLINAVLEETNYCGEAGCSVIDCSFWRITSTCESWCTDKGGKNISTSYFGDSQQCVIPKVNLGSEPIVLDCEPGTGIIETNCAPTTSRCEQGGGTATAPELDSGGVLKVLCTPPASVLSCTAGVRGQFDCDRAMEQCSKSGRTPAVIEGRRGSISCN